MVDLSDGRSDDAARRAAFISRLNQRLPTKRLIAQALIRDPDGAVLLCELIYKREWDLPGGVVDRDEAPAATVARELREELGLRLEVGALLAVNWLPRYRQWDDALLMVFEVPATREVIAEAVLQPTEVAALHWCGPEQIEANAAPYVARHLAKTLDAAAARPAATLYLEDGNRPGTAG